MSPAAPFEPAGAGFRAAPLTRGPWDERMMHGGAPAALLAHAIEQTEPGSEIAVTRLTIEFLGGVPVGPVEVETSLAKPGSRFQIVEGTLDAGGRRACLARAVRVRRTVLPDAVATPPDLLPHCPLPTPGAVAGGSARRAAQATVSGGTLSTCRFADPCAADKTGYTHGRRTIF